MKNFKEVVNEEIRPQDNLYGHVNNKWLKENPIPEEESTWSNFHELNKLTQKRLYKIVTGLLSRNDIKPGSIEQKVKDFYLSGKDKASTDKYGREKIADLFSEIDKCKNNTGLVKVLAKLHLMGIYPLWYFYVDQDEVNSSQYLLRFHQSGLSLPDRDYYDLKSEKMKKFKTELEKHIPKMFNAVDTDCGADLGQKIYFFEKELAKHSMTSVEQRDVEANYNKISFAELQGNYPNINWTVYFKTLGIKPPNHLSVDQTVFFEFLNKLISKTDVEFLRYYLKWHSLKSLSAYMGENVYQANFEFYGKTLNGTPKIKPLWKRLIIAIDANIGEALGKLYVDEYFPPVAKQRMENMVKDLKKSFADRIKKLEWMETETKQYALKKLDKVYVKVGYPKKLRKYSGLEINPQSFIDNYVDATIYENRRDLNKLGKPVDREEWHMTPPTVNAYFSPNTNEITFPAGILQPPFFDFKADDAVNYGGIGMVIGHELTHGFDDQGTLFDADGNLSNWRSKKDKQEFEKRAQAVVEQASEFEVLDGHKLNGKLTLGENIADIGGAEISFQALQYALERNGRPGQIDNFEPEERFFLNFARVWRNKIRDEMALRYLLMDPHSPGEFRINNTVRNMDAFYKTFRVKKGDKLYLEPKKRARIW